ACRVEQTGPANATLRIVGFTSLSQSHAIQTMGDLDGDGRSEVMIQSEFVQVGDDRPRTPASVSIFLGSTIASSPLDAVLSLRDADYTFTSPDEFPRINYRGPLGDLDGDGRDDLMLTSEDSGTTVVLLASTILSYPRGSTLDLTEFDYRLNRAQTFNVDQGELSAVGAGDVDGDGRPDILLSSPGYPATNVGDVRWVGKSYLVLSSTLLQHPRGSQHVIQEMHDYAFLGPQEGGGTVGESLAGDVDGDGVDDLVFISRNADLDDPRPIGQTDRDGTVQVVLGREVMARAPKTVFELATESSYVLHGEDDAGSVVRGVRFGGDVDGDGLADLLTIGWGRIKDSDGEVRLLDTSAIMLGSTLSANPVGSEFMVLGDADYAFGSSFDSENPLVRGRANTYVAGDVDGDGLDDLLDKGSFLDGATEFFGGQLRLGTDVAQHETGTPACVHVHHQVPRIHGTPGERRSPTSRFFPWWRRYRWGRAR
ncbi:MAG: FG-GAP repeat protein, partial [Longimicrobiales bacterium]